jgi:hypothetical protein
MNKFWTRIAAIFVGKRCKHGVRNPGGVSIRSNCDRCNVEFAEGWRTARDNAAFLKRQQRIREYADAFQVGPIALSKIDPRRAQIA